MILLAAAVITQHFDLCGRGLVVGGDHAAIAVATEVLAREKTECPGGANGSRDTLTVAAAE